MFLTHGWRACGRRRPAQRAARRPGAWACTEARLRRSCTACCNWWSVSGFEAYRKIYSDVITPRRVAELLILRRDMPRSLHACLVLINETLKLLCDDDNWELERMCGELHARLEFGTTDDIMREGLHEYLIDFLERIHALDSQITRRFLVPTY